ncbi:L-ascorbate oxidase [Camellia lanceoleosa]|nr:L-ascorbate oxidase [Camellia lanceoleosa]
MVELCQIVTRLLSVCLLVCLVISVPSAEASRVRHFKWEVKHEFKSPDCYNKLVITINGKSPGPTILAQQSDAVIVELKNSLETENVAIHWHGIRQIGSPWSDGTEGITQCPILPGDTFVYQFVVDRPGTYMYHAHYGMQRTCGLYGSIRVAHPDGESEPFYWCHKSPFEQAAGLSSMPFVWVGEPQSLLIQGKGQFDCYTPGESEPFSCYYDRSIILNNWCHKSPFEQAAGLSSIPFVWVGEPQSLLIQGKVQFDCSTLGIQASLCNATNPECSPYVLWVILGKTYRLRIGNLTALATLSFETEGHNMTVVDADGHYVELFVVKNLFIYSGEAYPVGVWEVAILVIYFSFWLF